MPENVSYIIGRLRERGYEAFAVGGCVRDSLIGRKPNDWDITSSALPQQVEKCFPDEKIIETGMKHGTVTLLKDGEMYEITAFRKDGEYLDHRRPESVEYVTDIKEDLSRRDFTVNAIAYNESKGIVDPFGGISDIRSRTIRCVGEPEKRFGEDALRIMRCIRFASELGFEIEEKTGKAALELAPLLSEIAAERIRKEFVRLLCGPAAVPVLRKYRDIIAVFVPEIKDSFECEQQNDYHIYDVWEHTLHAVNNIKPEPVLRLAAFFHDIAKPECKTVTEDGWGHFYHHEHAGSDMTGRIMRRLRFENRMRSTVCQLVKNHGIVFSPNGKQPARLLRKLGEERLRQLIELERADVKSQAPFCIAERLENIDRFEDAVNRLIEEERCFSKKDLAVDGRDLIELGIPQGPQIGRMLDMLLDEVVDGKLENRKEILLQRVKEKAKENEKPD